MHKVETKKKIEIEVGLDAQNMPVEIKWNAEDSKAAEPKECKAFMLSLFDAKHMDTFKIDLWTKEMQVMEMDRFFFQTLKSMADTYFRATQNKDLATDMQRFVEYFGEKTNVIPKGN